LQNLREVVAHFKTPYIILEELSTGALRLPMDERDFQTTAFLASVPVAQPKNEPKAGAPKAPRR
jgi:hypothetical protein